MSMSEERLQILQMLQEGQITAEEAAQLLDALQMAENDTERFAPADSAEKPQSTTKAKWLHIKVHENNGNVVNLKVPAFLVRGLMRLGGGVMVRGFDSNELSPEDIAEMEKALLEGQVGPIIDVVDKKGDHVQIYLE